MARRQFQGGYVNQNVPGRPEEQIYEGYEAVEIADLPAMPPPPPPNLPQQGAAQSRKNVAKVKYLAIALAVMAVVFAGMFAVVFAMLMTSSGSTSMPTSSNQSATHAEFGGTATNVVATEEVDAEKSKVITELRAIQDKMAKMEREHEQQITVMNKTLEGFHVRQLLLGDRCKVEYQGKCFWAIKTREPGTVALGYCKSEGGHGANIYGADNFELIRKYLFTLFSNGQDVFTGMNYNQETKVLSFANGTQSSFIDWYEGEDTTGSIMIDIGRRSTPSSAGFWTLELAGSRNGVLCEI